MSGTIWLITEDENDYKVVRAIIKKLNIPVNVKWRSPSGKTPGLSRLARELDRLIAEARALLGRNDCIVVLHDADTQRQPDRRHYDRVREICDVQRVKLIVAHNEMEAWLLSDSGVCAWLGQPVRNWNNEAWPSDRLRSFLQARHRMKYPRDLDKVLVHLAGDGINESFQAARTELENAPCVN